MKKKILPIFLSVIIFFSAYFIQVQSAAAGPELAIPAGIEVGAGVYVGGALILAGLAGAFGYSQYSEDINAHAKRVWDGAQQITKDMIIASYDAAVKAGKNVMEIAPEVWADLSSLIAKEAVPVNDKIMNGSIFTSSCPSTCSYTLRGSWVIQEYYMDGSKRNTYKILNNVSSSGSISVLGYTWNSVKPVWNQGLIAVLAAISGVAPNGGGLTLKYDLVYTGTSTITEDAIKSGIASSFGTANFPTTVRIPMVDEFKPTTVVDGQTKEVVWDPATSTWKTKDGAVTVPNTAVNVGAPTITLENGKVTATDFTGKKTDVIAESTPPPVVQPGSKGKIDWSKLTMALSTLKTVFPFSIPWDMLDFLGQFNVNPKTPIFHLKSERTINLGGKSIPINFDWTLDFSFLDGIAKIARWGLIIAFDVYMITALRKFTPD